MAFKSLGQFTQGLVIALLAFGLLGLAFFREPACHCACEEHLVTETLQKTPSVPEKPKVQTEFSIDDFLPPQKLLTCSRGSTNQPLFRCGNNFEDGFTYGNRIFLDYVLTFNSDIKRAMFISSGKSGDQRYFEVLMAAREGKTAVLPPGSVMMPPESRAIWLQFEDDPALVNERVHLVSAADILCVQERTFRHGIGNHSSAFRVYFDELATTLGASMKCYTRVESVFNKERAALKVRNTHFCGSGRHMFPHDMASCNNFVQKVTHGAGGYAEQPADFSVVDPPSFCSYLSLECTTAWHTFGKIASPCSWADKITIDAVWGSRPHLKNFIELGAMYGVTSVFQGFLAQQRGGTFHTFDYTDHLIPEVLNAWLPNMKKTIGPDGDLLSSTNMLVKVAMDAGPALVFFDNGNKNKELEVYGKFLKEGDVCCVHDWGAEIDFASTEAAVSLHSLYQIGFPLAESINSAVRCWEKKNI